MAFPTIPTVAAGRILFTLNTAGGATKTFPNLSSLTKNAGDLLLAICVEYDGHSTDAEFSAWGGGFSETGDRAGTATMAIGVAHKWSTGSETGTFTVTTADTSANDSVLILMSIPGAHATTPPEVSVMTTSAAAPPAVGTALNPGAWASEDTLWIAVAGSGETGTGGSYTAITAAPTNYTDLAASGITADVVGGVNAAVAFRQLNAASEAPGAWTADTSNARGAALVIAVRPVPSTDLSGTATVSGGGTITATGSPKRFTGVARISLEGGDTPSVDDGHAIVARARVTSGSGTLLAALYEGANNRSGDLSATLTTSLATYTLPIDEADAAAISDYSDLELRIWGESTAGATFEVAEVSLSIPEGVESHDGTATISGGGAATATVSKGALRTATISGGGSLSATGSKATTRTPTLSGGGAASAVVTKNARAPPVLSGGGALSATGVVSETHSGFALLSGGGDATATVLSARSETATASGGGALLATSSRGALGFATVSGGGVASATGVPADATAIAISGGGDLAATISRGVFATPAISGGGSLSAIGSAAESHSGSAALSGGGDVSATAVLGAQAAPALSGGGSPSGSDTTARSEVASLSGGGSLSATGTSTETHSGSAIVSGGGALATTATSDRPKTISVPGGGSVTATTSSGRSGDGAIAGGGALSASGTTSEAHSGFAVLSGGGSVSSSGDRAAFVSATLSGGGDPSAEGQSASIGVTSLSGGGAISATVSRSASDGTHISGGGDVVVEASPGTPAVPPVTDRARATGEHDGRLVASGRSGRADATPPNRGSTSASNGGSGRTD